MVDITAAIKDHDLATLRQLKMWIDFALGDDSVLTDETFGDLIAFTLDKRILSTEEMMVVAAASKSQLSRWRHQESLLSDRHKKQGVMRDLQVKIKELIDAKALPRKRQKRSKVRE